MTGPFLTVTIEKDQEVLELLSNILRRVVDLGPVFRGPIDASVTKMVRKQFESNGSYGGQPWAPIKESTQFSRIANRGGIEHPLWDTGEGKESLENPASVNGFREITPSSYNRGSTLTRMALHQVGYTISQWGGHSFGIPIQVPARPIIPDPIPDEVLEEWEVAIQEYLESLGG